MNGAFRWVTYNGTSGWAWANHLTPISGPGEDSPPPGQGPLGGTGRTTTAVNLREGAGTTYRVLLVIPAGARVNFGDQIANGFRNVTYNGVSGWASDQYIDKSGGGPGGPGPIYKKTTTVLNLRAQPNTSARVLLVMPAGASVRISDQSSNGFRLVSYNNTSGWASEAYLA